MYAIKTPSFFRPASRPSSPGPAPPSRPDSGIGMERSRPLNKLSLTTFRRASPAPGPPASGTTTTTTPSPLPQDGSYLEMLSLKLGEAVSKALSQPSGPPTANEQVSGRRPLPAGRGHALGNLIASELRASKDNPHLYRAILRSLHRPLSVLLSNMSSLLLPLLSSPQLHALPSTVPQAPVLNPTQLHAVSISTMAGELLETFDEIGLGIEGDIRGDGLKLIREGLFSVVSRVVNPFLNTMKAELAPLIESLETPGGKITKSGGALHPSLVTLQSVMPTYSKAIARYTNTPASQTILASHLISLIWKGLIALSSRPFIPSPPSSPLSVPVGAKKRRGSGTTPPLTPTPTRFTIKLPSSRPPSPTSLATSSTSSSDARVLYDLLNMLPRPDATKSATRLAREAVDEAYDGLQALSGFIELVYFQRPGSVEEIVSQLEKAAADIPTLIALPIVMHVYGRGGGETVATLLGISEGSYRTGCLTGFGRAEECATAVGQSLLDILASSSGRENILYKWLEAEIAEDILPSSI